MNILNIPVKESSRIHRECPNTLVQVGPIVERFPCFRHMKSMYTSTTSLLFKTYV